MLPDLRLLTVATLRRDLWKESGYCNHGLVPVAIVADNHRVPAVCSCGVWETDCWLRARFGSHRGAESSDTVNERIAFHGRGSGQVCRLAVGKANTNDSTAGWENEQSRPFIPLVSGLVSLFHLVAI